MPNPKRRHSKARGAKRRTHYTVRAMTTIACPTCGAPVVPHRACAACGHYKGRQVIAVRQSAE